MVYVASIGVGLASGGRSSPASDMSESDGQAFPLSDAYDQSFAIRVDGERYWGGMRRYCCTVGPTRGTSHYST
jgi:hypothetical protein